MVIETVSYFLFINTLQAFLKVECPFYLGNLKIIVSFLSLNVIKRTVVLIYLRSSINLFVLF